MTAALEAVAILCACLALGHGLEYLASAGYLGLDRVPLGPGSGADAMASTPSPFGEHGWLPVPLGVLDLLLLFGAAGRWRADSWWSGCIGALWGQLPSLAVCAFGILPSLVAAWLLWMPHICLPLPITLAIGSAALSLSSLLFWSDLLPLLPRARRHTRAFFLLLHSHPHAALSSLCCCQCTCVHTNRRARDRHVPAPFAPHRPPQPPPCRLLSTRHVHIQWAHDLPAVLRCGRRSRNGPEV